MLRGEAEWLGLWVFFDRSDDRAIGDLIFLGNQPDAGDGRLTLAYQVAGPQQSQGYGGEAVSMLADFALRQPNVGALLAFIEEGNGRSQRIVNRLGFKPTGHRNPAGAEWRLIRGGPAS